jgi:hypothetical protein
LAYHRYGNLAFFSDQAKTDQIGQAEIQADGTWSTSVTIPAGVTIYAFVYMGSSSNEGILVGSRAPTETGSWDLGTHNFVSLSGTLSVTINGEPFTPNQGQNKYLGFVPFDAASGPIGMGYLLAANGGNWRVILRSKPGSRTIGLRVYVSSPGGDNYSKQIPWTGELNTTPKTTGLLNVEMAGGEINDTLVVGVKDLPIMNGFVTLSLQGKGFTGITQSMNVSSWFTNLPGGLAATAGQSYQNGTNSWSLQVQISGTPTGTTAAGGVAIAVTIPGANNSGGSDITVPPNPNAIFYIAGSSATINGSIDLRLDGAAYDAGVDAGYYRYGTLQFYTNPNRNGSSLPDAPQIDSNGDWSLSIPEGLPVDYLYAFAYMDPMGTESLPVGQRAPAGGSWDMGPHEFVSLSGTLSVSINGQTFVPNQGQNKYLCVTAFNPATPEIWQIGGGYSIFAANGAWRIILPSVTGSRTIGLRVYVFSPGGNYSKQNGVWTGQVTNAAVSGVGLNVSFP